MSTGEDAVLDTSVGAAGWHPYTPECKDWRRKGDPVRRLRIARFGAENMAGEREERRASMRAQVCSCFYG